MIITYKYRIKDSASKRELSCLASNVNFVWNYVVMRSMTEILIQQGTYFVSDMIHPLREIYNLTIRLENRCHEKINAQYS